jgi:hypothetical protein
LFPIVNLYTIRAEGVERQIETNVIAAKKVKKRKKLFKETKPILEMLTKANLWD